MRCDYSSVLVCERSKASKETPGSWGRVECRKDGVKLKREVT